ncbi:Maf family protein [Natroniella sulfidigena]|uniref:Maf family protein n=1 Tax=Natroniella sulfidigena TaxID=723921 RepID=UPI00200A293C|nr:Maf family protein [Natroniella sulfidigena]MCK8815867.1 Maf family protein [Natroniella sulfidigena]
MEKIILASSSPRRRELLARLGVKFEVRPSKIDENKVKEDRPDRLVQKLSFLKAEDVINTQDEIVIAADTVVSLDNKILGKPKDSEEAFRMLTKLSGQKHQVLTGTTVLTAQRRLTDYQATSVSFKELTAQEIEEYIATGEPLDKAGSYGIQGMGAVFVKEINGCFYNVVGLSLYNLRKMLTELGVKFSLNG